MKNSCRRLSVYFGLAAVLYAAGAVAASSDPGTTENAGLEDVIVTAQKRSERAMDVPVAVTSLNANDLVEQNLVRIEDYYSRIPDLQYSCTETFCLSLRGITTGGATNPTLAILIDDVQFGATTASGLGDGRFPDIDPSILDRVEVLRGPQGTLYGAASLGGLIKYVTRQPDTTQFSGRVEAGMDAVDGGSIGWTTRGSVNLPLVSNVAALSLSAFTREDPGYINNLYDPVAQTGFGASNVNDAHTYGEHVALLLKPIDDLTITLSALDQRRHGYFSDEVPVLVNANGAPTYVATYGRNSVSLSASSDTGDQQLYSGRVELNLGNVQLLSLTAWGKSDNINKEDLTSTFSFILPFYGAPIGSVVDINDEAWTEKFSQEFRASGKIDKLDWRTGLFYTKEMGGVFQLFPLVAPSGTHLATPLISDTPETYEEKAIYADGVYHFTDAWDIQAGIRYSRNEQTTGSVSVVDVPIQAVFGPSIIYPPALSNDSSVTWAVAPTYHISPDLMGYLRVATGYRPGGPNTVVGDIPVTYRPDTVVNYEAGLKGFEWGHAVSFDLALFEIDWKNIQLQDTDAATQIAFNTNGGRARSRGLESAISWKPIGGLTVDANATMLDATLRDPLPTLVTANGLVGAAGDRLPASARFSGNLGVQQDFPLSAAVSAFVGANWSFVGARYGQFLNVAATAPRLEMPSYSDVDLRAGFTIDSSWHVSLFARNVLGGKGVITADNRNGTADSRPQYMTGFTEVQFLQPRTVGFSVAKTF